MIRFENISFLYDDFLALQEIDFEIKNGEKIVLLGNNGCGKSTILKIMAGLLYPKKGRYLYKDKEITKKYLKKYSKDFRKEVAILFQNPDIMLFNPTVKDEILFSLKEMGLDTDVDEILKKFDILHLEKRNPLTLSGGEKQKVAFAAIFVANPSLLLLDEPTANLDPKSTGWLIDFINSLDITTVISTHNLSLAYELGDRAIVLDETHQVIYDGEIEKLFSDKELLLKANLVHKHKHKHTQHEHSHFHIHDWD